MKTLSVRLPSDLVEAVRTRARRRNKPLKKDIQKLLELYVKGLDPDDIVLIPKVDLATLAKQANASEQKKAGSR